MQQHAVPQNVTSFEFKIVGFLTLKQFAMLATCGVLAFISFLSIENFVLKIVVVIFLVGLGVLLAFGSIQNIPFYRWIFIFIKAIFSPTQRVWIKSSEAPSYFTTAFAGANIVPEKKFIEDRTVLSSYLQTLPTQKRTSLDALEHQKLQSLSLQQSSALSTISEPAPGLANTPFARQPLNPPQALPPTAPVPPKPAQVPMSTPAPTPQPSKPTPASNIPPLPQFPSQASKAPEPPRPPTAPITAPLPKPTQTQSAPIQSNLPPFAQNMPPIANKTQAPQPMPTPVPQSKPAVVTPPAPMPAKPNPQPLPPMPTQAPKPVQPAPQPIQAPKPPEVKAAPTPLPPAAPLPTPKPIQQAQPMPQTKPAIPPQQPIAAPIPTAPVPTLQAPAQQSPKLWSTIQVIEREFLQELRDMRANDEKEKAELKARLVDIERKQQDLEKQKTEFTAQKDAEIKNIQDAFEKQRAEIEARHELKSAEEEKYLREMQQKFDEEKTKRELYEKNNSELDAQLKTLIEEKTILETNTAAGQASQAEVTALNNQIEEMQQKIQEKAVSEQRRQTEEEVQLKTELELQMKTFEEQKVQLQKDRTALQQEKAQMQKQNKEIEEQRKKLDELQKSLETRQQEITTKQTEQAAVFESKTNDLETLASQLQKETEKIPSRKAEGITKAENALVSEKAAQTAQTEQKARTQKLKATVNIITELETANIPPITSLVNVINGVVYDANGNLVPNVIIIVKDTEKTPVRALKSNRLGQFAISTPLPNGAYNMEFEDSKEEKQFDIYQITLTGSVVAPIAIKEKE